MNDVKEKYFINRLGFINECKADKECENIYDILGFVMINITKRNKKTFRVDRYTGLYKKVPETWIEYSKDKLHIEALKKIKNIIINGYYNETARRAFKLLSEKDKKIICESLKKEAEKTAKIAYNNKIYLFNDRLTQKKYSYDKADRIIEKHTEKE